MMDLRTNFNPFRLIERILKIVGYSIAGLAAAACLAIVAWNIAVKAGWGWWTLTLIPGIPLALGVIALIGLSIEAGGEAIERAWTRWKRNWDQKRRES